MLYAASKAANAMLPGTTGAGNWLGMTDTKGTAAFAPGRAASMVLPRTWLVTRVIARATVRSSQRGRGPAGTVTAIHSGMARGGDGGREAGSGRDDAQEDWSVGVELLMREQCRLQDVREVAHAITDVVEVGDPPLWADAAFARFAQHVEQLSECVA